MAWIFRLAAFDSHLLLRRMEQFFS